MEVVDSMEVACTPAVLFEWLDDLCDYPTWMPLVHRVDPLDDGSWRVELRAAVGPLARSKRLRMVRSDLDAPHHVRFVRDEADGRQHSPWELTADVVATTTGSSLRIRLFYGGGLWTGGLLERALTDQIEHGKANLNRLVSEQTPSNDRSPGGRDSTPRRNTR